MSILRKVGRLAAVLVMGLGDVAITAASDIELAKKYVPQGAVLETFKKPAQDRNSEALPVVVSGQIDPFSESVLCRAMTNEKATLDTILPGKYAQTIGEGALPIVIKRLVRNLPPMILVGTSDSASVGSYLDVFEVRDTIRNLAGGPIEGSSFSIGCSGTDACRLLAWGKWSDHGSAWVNVWSWNGRTYVRTGAEAEKYMDRKLGELGDEASSGKQLPVYLRVAVARLAAEEYTVRRDCEKALSLSRNVLSRAGRSDAEFAADKRFRQIDHGY
jgi:hypothetical protein